MEKRTHILVVDDEQYILESLRKTLELEGFAVTVAVLCSRIFFQTVRALTFDNLSIKIL